MADPLLIKAIGERADLRFEFVDSRMATCGLQLESLPDGLTVKDGDVWRVSLVERKKIRRRDVCVVRLIARVQELQSWERIQSLPGFWMHPTDLRILFIWLNRGRNVALIGPKGTGKTSLGYEVARALGWQDPLKVDVSAVKTARDLFGSDAADTGSTLFQKSALLNYIDRAWACVEEGVDTHFLVILDEMNRNHAKANECLHGLFDDFRQLTITTTEGSKIVRLPRNVHVMATLNIGANYVGVFNTDEALKDRFMTMRVQPMPFDFEVAKLARESGLIEAKASAIVQTAQALRAAADAGQLTFSPSYRGCLGVADLVAFNVNMRDAIIAGFLGWYEGELRRMNGDYVISPNSEMAKAHAALTQSGVAKMKDLAVVRDIASAMAAK